MTTCTVALTAADIEAGVPESSRCCPLALAMTRAVGQPVAVTGSVAFAGPWYGPDLLFVLPAEAREFARRFDAGEDVEPMVFEVGPEDDGDLEWGDDGA